MSPAAAPLARSQEALWEFLSCFAPDDPGALGYNVFDTATWDGPVDPEVFRLAVGDVMRRHDALRIVFAQTGLDPAIRVLDEVDTSITFADLSGQPPRRRAALKASLLGYERRRAYDLREGPLWKCSLLRLQDERHLVAVSLFHMIADGWSTGVFLRDLRGAYLARTGQGPALPPLPLSYQAAMAPPRYGAAEARRRADYWKRSLNPLPGPWPYEPALDSPDVDVCAEASLELPIEADLVGRLHAFARQQRVTPFVLFLAAYRILLGIRTGWPRVVIGTATAGRDAAGTEHLIGQFTHNIYLATTIAPDATLLEALGTVRSSMYEAMRHTASFYEIARAVNADFDAMRPWPFLLLYHAWFQSAPPTSAPRPSSEQPREHRSRSRGPSAPVTDPDALRLWAKKGEPGLVVRHDRRGAAMHYNPTLYSRDTMMEVLHGYTAVLTGLLTDPHQRIRDLKLP